MYVLIRFHKGPGSELDYFKMKLSSTGDRDMMIKQLNESDDRFEGTTGRLSLLTSGAEEALLYLEEGIEVALQVLSST